MFFRQSTLEQARRLGLDGWVRNRADGDVEGLAAGDEEPLEALHRWLHRGPPRARVDRVDWEPGDEEAPPGFAVRA